MFGPRTQRALIALLLVAVAGFCVVMVVRKGGWWWMIADIPVLAALYYLFDSDGWKGARSRPDASDRPPVA
jgi:hypothetical protein